MTTPGNFFSSLTENDLRPCAYLSIGMERKQIARMLVLQPASIRRACMRLRKKFQLASEDSLEDFLRRI